MPLIQLKTQVQGTIWTELDDSRLYKQVSNIFTMLTKKQHLSSGKSQKQRLMNKGEFSAKLAQFNMEEMLLVLELVCLNFLFQIPISSETVLVAA